MSTVAFVPARGGSSMHLKNIRPLCGRPLIAWCLRALEEAPSVQRVVVATDADVIEQAVRELGLDKVEVWRRSAASATDTAPTEMVMQEWLAQDGIGDADRFILVQATSPFTRAADFEAALQLFATSGADSLLSCVRSKRFFWREDGTAINYDWRARPRRQEFAGWLMENGAFYVSRAGAVRAHGNRLGGRIVPFEMPEHTALELDEEDDWAMAEMLLSRHVVATRPGGAVRMLLTDVDGVLTDAGMYYGSSGEELKKFNTLDGMAFELCREHGIKTGIVTGESTRIVAGRARKVRADHLRQGVKDKLVAVRELCALEGLELEEVAYLGDDVNDLEVLRAVGLAACPASAAQAVRAAVHHVCRRGGGQGCVRELVDLILTSAVVGAATLG